MVRALVMEELDREADKIVTVSGHEAPFLLGGPVELIGIRTSFGADLVDADRINAPCAEQLGNLLAEVLVQVEDQGRSGVREGYRSASRACVQASF